MSTSAQRPRRARVVGGVGDDHRAPLVHRLGDERVFLGGAPLYVLARPGPTARTTTNSRVLMS